MLPGETEFADEISRTLDSELKFGEAVLDTCLSVLLQREARKHPDGDGLVAYRIGHALCAKGCKTFRSVLRLSRIGATHDMDILSRSLFETTAAIAFVVRPEVAFGIKGFPDARLTSDFRASVYAAHHPLNHYKDFAALAKDGRFEKPVKTVDIEKLRRSAERSTKEIGEFWASRLTKSPRTYSGFNLKELTSKLDPDLSKWYAVVYGLQSKPTHAVDAIRHVRFEDETGRMLIKWHSTINDVREGIVMSSTLLLRCLWELNERYDFEDNPNKGGYETKRELQILVNEIDAIQRRHYPPEAFD